MRLTAEDWREWSGDSEASLRASPIRLLPAVAGRVRRHTRRSGRFLRPARPGPAASSNGTSRLNGVRRLQARAPAQKSAAIVAVVRRLQPALSERARHRHDRGSYGVVRVFWQMATPGPEIARCIAATLACPTPCSTWKRVSNGFSRPSCRACSSKLEPQW